MFGFQQDNAGIHVSKSTSEFLDAHGVEFLEWPAYGPDLNPMQNLWSILSRRFYAGHCQYRRVDYLKKAILDEWTKIEADMPEI
ncbi:hypothetical protein Y032_0337g2917 [Ancylostoma ceylanicum]|uniref:Tc1-like transposase DDE domain-containing protein n=1 Tax=Ancylostoma ceylanicum TaxID=53326 RepID=A0A016RYB6_9BILA|nr:hypothetical protein Y032_0337g2917 [Ancylostoma ceylanicum]